MWLVFANTEIFPPQHLYKGRNNFYGFSLRNKKIEMAPVIFNSFWVVLFGQLWMCFSLPVQNYSTSRTTLMGSKTTSCLNFCMFHTCNHGQCMQDPNNCNTWCQCLEGFTGARCDVHLQTSTGPEDVATVNIAFQNTSTDDIRSNIGKIFAETANFDVSQTIGEQFEVYNNLEECSHLCHEGICSSNGTSIHCIPKNCPVGFGCENGRCEYKSDNGFRCVCVDGWVGDFCNSKCNLDCGKFGKCIVSSGLEKCVCDLAHTGKLCHKEAPSFTTLPSDTQYKYLAGCKHDCTDLCIPINNSYYCMPKGKNCPLGFPCEHYCDVNNSGLLRCICEPGWIGDMCNKECNMNCANHGVCGIDRTNEQVCLCDFNYTGIHCEQLVASSLNST